MAALPLFPGKAQTWGWPEKPHRVCTPCLSHLIPPTPLSHGSYLARPTDLFAVPQRFWHTPGSGLLPGCSLSPDMLCISFLWLKYPHGWLKTTEMFSLAVLEAGRLKSRRRQQVHALFQGTRGEFFQASSSFWHWPGILGVLWLVHASLQSPVHFLPVASHRHPSVQVCLCVHISLLYKDTSHSGLGLT